MIRQILEQRKNNTVLGRNHRNVIYMRPYNKRRAKRIADDKLLCKKILGRHEIPTAEIFKVIRNRKQLESIKWDSLPKSFALKPNIGTGGSGILVFFGRKKKTLEWIRSDGTTMGVSAIRNHISKILDGQYSMGNRKDIAIIEERIINHPDIKKYCYKGIPDLRIIVFNKVPIMAMVRLPTKESEGVANLHAGGICVGIDIGSGVTTVAMRMKSRSMISDTYRIVETTEDENQLPLSGIEIPQWDKILKISVNCQIASGLGFVGVDVALDRYKGPIVFELNARPGLGIQMANRDGMRNRLDRVKGLKIKDADHGIRVAKNLFGGEIEDEVKAVTGRQIIGLVEKATFYPPEPVETPSDKKSDSTKKTKTKKKRRKTAKPKGTKVKVQIDTGIIRSRLSQRIATRLGYKPVLDHFRGLEIPKDFESRDEAKKFLEAGRNEEIITSHPLVAGVSITSEKDKIVLRPTVEVKFSIAGEPMTATMILSQESDLPYPAVIGKIHLKKFLIDASKTFSLH